MRKRALFDDKVKERKIKKNNLVLGYKNELDTHFQKKFIPKWRGPFAVKEVYSPCYFQLMNLYGTPHKQKVNGYCLKLYLICDTSFGSIF